jgi:hypothetical protein
VGTTSDGRDLGEVTPARERALQEGASLRAHIERVEQSLRAQSSIAKTALADLCAAQQRTEAERQRADAERQRAVAAEGVSLDQQAQASALRTELEQRVQELRLATALYVSIERSNSWRLTLPLRLLGKAVRGRNPPPAVPPVQHGAPDAGSAPANGAASRATPDPPATPLPGLAEGTETMLAASRRWSLGQRR